VVHIYSLETINLSSHYMYAPAVSPHQSKCLPITMSFSRNDLKDIPNTPEGIAVASMRV